MQVLWIIRGAMSNAAVNIFLSHHQGSETARFVEQMNRERYRSWRATVGAIQSAAGARPVLVHVPETVWQARFAANDSAFTAVVEELAKFDD